MAIVINYLLPEDVRTAHTPIKIKPTPFAKAEIIVIKKPPHLVVRRLLII
jgi:hypothetical protein